MNTDPKSFISKYVHLSGVELEKIANKFKHELVKMLQKFLASFIGVTPTSLNRTRKQIGNAN